MLYKYASSIQNLYWYDLLIMFTYSSSQSIAFEVSTLTISPPMQYQNRKETNV